MRARALVVVLMCFVGLLAPPATAQEAEALKKEIEQLRKQLESVTERLRRLEAQPAPVTPRLAPPPVPSPTGPPAMAPPQPPGASLTELARPRQPFSLYQQRGAGQLLFDIGIAGDFVGNITQSNVEKAQGGTFAGQENRFFPREVELSLFGQVDPYAYAEVRIETGEEARGQELGVKLAEASVTLLTLPLGTQAEFGDENAVQLGMSVASGETTEKQRDTLLGWEGRYKYRPDGWLHPLVTVTGEAIYSLRRVLVEADTDGDGIIDRITKREKDRFGWYAGAEVQPFRRWAAGVRYDWSEFPANPGKERSVEPYVTFWPSEFLRFRLAYKNTDRTHRESADANDGSAKKVDEVLFQGTFILGAHPAHPF